MKLSISNLQFSKLILIFLFTNSLFFVPTSTQAAGLVPCGGTGEPACGFCHIFVLFNNIVNFLFRLVPPIAALMLVFAGAKFFMAVNNPGEVTKAKELIKSVIIGLIIIYGAWAFVGAFLATIGLATWTQNIFSSWWTDGLFQINCPTLITSSGITPVININQQLVAPAQPAAFLGVTQILDNEEIPEPNF